MNFLKLCLYDLELNLTHKTTNQSNTMKETYCIQTMQRQNTKELRNTSPYPLIKAKEAERN